MAFKSAFEKVQSQCIHITKSVYCSLTNCELRYFGTRKKTCDDKKNANELTGEQTNFLA